MTAFYTYKVMAAARFYRKGEYEKAFRAYESLIESSSITFKLLSSSKRILDSQVFDQVLERWNRRILAAIKCRRLCLENYRAIKPPALDGALVVKFLVWLSQREPGYDLATTSSNWEWDDDNFLDGESERQETTVVDYSGQDVEQWVREFNAEQTKRSLDDSMS